MLLTTAFLLGLASTFHCIGMCGPVSLALPLNRQSSWSILSGLIQYHIGRISMYTVLGLIIGSIGLSLRLFHVLQWLSMFMGVVMIVFAWKRQWIHKVQLQNNRFMQWIVRGMGSLLASKSPGKLFGLGTLNGLLPCGMVYVGLGNALLSGDIVGTGAAMAVFGLGTFPAMLAVGYFARQVNGPVRQRINRVFPVLLTIVGCMLIVRGANLGIPYLSPAVNEQTVNDEKTGAPIRQTVVVDCHKPYESK
jgi:sulfite exporter TauE/SafE